MLLMSCVCHDFASVHCCLVVTCWERADLLAFVFMFSCVFVTFPLWYPGSGVVLDCIDTRSLPLFLLSTDKAYITFPLLTLNQTPNFQIVLMFLIQNTFQIY